LTAEADGAEKGAVPVDRDGLGDRLVDVPTKLGVVHGEQHGGVVPTHSADSRSERGDMKPG
jgi:hypothetical protein